MTAEATLRVERWGGAPERAALAVLAVHGRDQEPGFMRSVTDRVGLEGLAWYAPAAPGRTWYPKRFTEPFAANEPFLSASLRAIGAVLGGVGRDGFRADRVVLLGFSQGACLLSEYLVRHPGRYAAAALLTGGFAGPPGSGREVAGDLAGTPVLLASSSRDGWVPVERVRETAALLRGAGAEVTLRVDEDPEHHVNDDTVAAVRDLLTRATG
ncbi:alpha/beta hydrolase [Pseudonocardia adelaidensis]|uniref:Dienelactone hydrolase family protein n=1 Tax=Pseudonocardia adelaidensis TaxID=648754 RepID=A0ABP9NC08_9PSEU